jgi:hypothetical protein
LPQRRKPAPPTAGLPCGHALFPTTFCRVGLMGYAKNPQTGTPPVPRSSMRSADFVARDVCTCAIVVWRAAAALARGSRTRSTIALLNYDSLALSDYHLYSIIGLRPDVVFPAFSLSRFSSVFQRVFPAPRPAERVADRPAPPQSNPRPAPRSDTTERPKTYKITESDSSTWPERSTRTVKPQHPRPGRSGARGVRAAPING